MAAKLERTNTPGIFRRHQGACRREGRCDCSYVVRYRARGKLHMESFPTFSEAREAKRARERAAAAGEFSAPTRTLLHEYAREWVDRYQGTGRRGFREETRDEYRRLLGRYALRWFAPTTKLSEIGPREIADFLGWLVKQPSSRGGTLSDKAVRNALGPLSACLGTARREGLIRHNPATEAVLPHRPRIEDDDDRPRPFPPGACELVLSLVNPKHRLMFELLAATGLRRSELLALEGRHLRLDGNQPCVKVRQRVRRQKGNGLVMGPLKSRYARRDLPIPWELASRLRALGTARDALVFAGSAGKVLDPDNLFERVLRPACSEAGVEWAGFHTFRHGAASRLFAEGRNVVQVQRWLGHHSASFTLDTYVHLLEDTLGEPLQVHAGYTERPQTAANGDLGDSLEMAA